MIFNSKEQITSKNGTYVLMKKRTKTLFAIYFAYFLDYFGYAIVFGIFGPLMLSPEFGMFSAETTPQTRNLALASLFAIFPLMQLTSAPIFGDLADHFGRKKTFVILNSGATLGYFLSGLATLSHHFPLLMISRFLTGIFSSNRTICMASLSDLSPDEQSRSNSYGVIATLGGLSWIVSMLVGGVFSESFNPAIPFWITTGLSCLSLGINLLWLNPYTLTRYPISNQSLFILLASTGIVWSLGSSVLNKLLLKRFHSQEIAYIGIIGLFIIFILCSLMKSFIPFAICALFASAFGALAWTNALSTISLKAPEDMQGKVMGIAQSFGSVSLLFAPLLAGSLAGVNIAYVYPMAALLILISMGVLSLATRKSRNPYESKI